MREYHLYRQVILAGISDEQILAKACEGQEAGIRVFYRFRGQPLALRAHLSQSLGQLEREHHKTIPEWCAPCQTFLVDTLAAAIEIKLFGAPSLLVGAEGLKQAARMREARREHDIKKGLWIP